MKKILFLTVISASLGLTCSQAFAEHDDETNVCVVQVAKVLHDAPQVKKDVEKLKAKFEADQKSIQTKQDALEKAVKDLKKNEVVMTPADKEKAEKLIADQRQQVIHDATEFQQKLSTEQKTIMDAVFKELNTVIQSVSKTKKCDVVLDSQFVLYAVPAKDVTAEVQKGFDKK